MSRFLARPAAWLVSLLLAISSGCLRNADQLDVSVDAETLSARLSVFIGLGLLLTAVFATVQVLARERIVRGYCLALTTGSTLLVLLLVLVG